MNTLSLVGVPPDVARQIEQDARDLMWREIMREMEGRLLGLEMRLDRGFSIRNYMQNWAVAPRFIHENRVYGFYIRSGRRVNTPL